MDSSGLRRKDTTRGPPLRILSLDGGGVRGYSMLIILQELMHRTFVENEGRAPRREEIPKPCDHFDLIVGTGTGGLIALMLGRLRMDLETCKDVYVRMTKRVFETDKTFAGIPYTSTLFKASKLEEAIRECVREHTVHEDEGNDEGNAPLPSVTSPTSPVRPGYGQYSQRPQRSMSATSRYSQIGAPHQQDFRSSIAAARYGKPNALLYDARENRTKTAITAVLRGTPKTGSSVLLRSYDSRKESALEPRCTVWQAGRATCATALAFKPIQVGQSTFLDEGAGKYNPAPQALDEAVINEWPGREVGVLVSIGTGKRPPNTNHQQHLWWEGFVSSGMGDFAEARRRLVSKIEGCEETHQWMKSKYLFDRNVDPANYFRLNVIAGVGEFGMNEWHRLAEISTNTRRYLGDAEVQNMNLNCAVRLARIHRANIRWTRAISGESFGMDRLSFEEDPATYHEPKPPLIANAVELPAGDLPQQALLQRPISIAVSPLEPPLGTQEGLYGQSPYRVSEDDKFVVHADEPYTYDQANNTLSPSSALRPENQHLVSPLNSRPNSSGYQYDAPYRRSHEMQRPTEQAYPPNNPISQLPAPLRVSNELQRPDGQGHVEVLPPRPPKTPIPGATRPSQISVSDATSWPSNEHDTGRPLAYPLDDGPPPVNMARKPALGSR